MFCFVRGREAGVCRNGRPSLIGSFKMILKLDKSPRKIPALSLPTDPVVTVQNEVMSKERRWKMYLRAVSLYDVFSTVPPPNNQCQYSSFRGVCESLRERQGLWAAQ
jgi:hypothetical protein